MDELLNSLMEYVHNNIKNLDADKIERAYQFAKEAHEGQLRESGDPYLSHPIEVAKILIDMGMDTDAIAAALLHDVVEDTSIQLEQVEKLFGKDVALLVDGVTKLGKIPLSTREEQQAENIRKMLLAMSQDIRVVIIKLADRLHNMRTIQFMPEQKQRDKALETMEVYAPIAHRLGIRAVKEELEDISLRYLDPVAYLEIEDNLVREKEERHEFLNRIKERISRRIEDDNHKMFIEGRVKSIYGIYRKVYMQKRAFEEIYDIYAVRIIVDTVIECYNILGVIHDMFRPIPNRFKDYISTPKPNMYQSLHTTVIDKEGIPFEVQIRTWDMHYTAEYGIAAHWKYKAGISGKDKLEEKLSWVRQLLEVQKESEDIEDIVRSIKSDIAPEEVFVFTPKGDVISLPIGSCVVDFAYAIHTAVGNRMIGAKVDGRMVSLDYQVKTGEIVEVITTNAQGHGPSRDWIKLVKTSEARNKIRSWFKKERREENIIQGKQELDSEFRRNRINLPPDEMAEFVADIAKRQHFYEIDDFYAAIGYGGISLSRIMPRIKEEFIKLVKSTEPLKPEELIVPDTKVRKNNSSVIVEGIENCLVKFSKCCNPLPGDDIIGFVTRGYGVSIHKKDCINVTLNNHSEADRDRWVKVYWAKETRDSYKSTLQIVAYDRQGLLLDVSMQLSNMRVPIHAVNAKEIKGSCAAMQVTIGIESVEQLKGIIAKLEKIEGVISVERAGNL